MFAVHPDTQCLKEVTFHVISHEGSIVLSCVSTLELSFIHPHNNFDSIPSSASLIPSNADHPRKSRSQKNMQVLQPIQNMCSSKEQSHIVSNSIEYHVNQCVVYEDQDETSKWECTAHDISMYEDKNCQSTLCYDKNCQDTQSVHMQPVKPAMKSIIYGQLSQQYYNLVTRKRIK